MIDIHRMRDITIKERSLTSSWSANYELESMYHLFSDEKQKVVYIILLQHSIMFFNVIYVFIVYKYEGNRLFIIYPSAKGEKDNYCVRFFVYVIRSWDRTSSCFILRLFHCREKKQCIFFNNSFLIIHL
jgi:hypothetical protein